MRLALGPDDTILCAKCAAHNCRAVSLVASHTLGGVSFQRKSQMRCPRQPTAAGGLLLLHQTLNAVVQREMEFRLMPLG